MVCYINMIYSLHVKLVYIFLPTILLHHNRKDLLDGIYNGILWEKFISRCPVNLIKMITLLIRRVEIKTSLKYFTQMFSVIEHTYFIVLGNTIMNLTQVFIKHISVFPPIFFTNSNNIYQITITESIISSNVVSVTILAIGPIKFT